MKPAVRFSLFSLLILLVVSFQNCTSSDVNFENRSVAIVPTPSSYSGGNGGGYDGKPFVLPDLSRVCTDGDAAKARILEKANVYRLVRWDCANLVTPQVVTVTKPGVQVSGSESLIYQDKVFDSQALLVSGAQLPTKGYCREVTSAATISVPQTVGTDFDVALVIAVSGPDLIASMVFDDNSTSDGYGTTAVKIGSSSAPPGPLVGNYGFSLSPASLSFDFVSGEAVVLATDMPVTDTDTPSVTGTLVNFDSTLTKCSWN